jgi:hypothetical protein
MNPPAPSVYDVKLSPLPFRPFAMHLSLLSFEFTGPEYSGSPKRI